MEWLIFFKPVIYCLYALLLMVLLYTLIEVARIVKNARRFSDRLDYISDLSNWLDILKFISKFIKRKK